MEREHKPEGTQGLSRLEVFEKAATKKDDHNHPNSLQRVDYRNENKKYFMKELSNIKCCKTCKEERT